MNDAIGSKDVGLGSSCLVEMCTSLKTKHSSYIQH